MKIKWKIALPVLGFMLLSAVMVTILGYFIIKNSVDSMMETIVDSNLNTLISQINRSANTEQIVLNEIDNKNITIARVLAEIVRLNTLRGTLNFNNVSFFEDIASLLGVTEINVTDNEGTIIGSNYADNYGFNYGSADSTRAYIQILSDPSFEIIEKMRASAVSGNSYQYLGTARTDAAGFVQVGFEANAVQNFYDHLDVIHTAADLNIGMSGHASILRNGIIIYSNDIEKITQDVNNESWYKQVSSGKGKSWINMGDETMYTGYANVDDMTLLILFPQNEYNSYLAPVQIVGITGVLIAVLAAFIMYLLVSFILRPVSGLVAASEKVAKGELEVKFDQVKGKDEISLLSLTVQNMAKKIKNMVVRIKNESVSLSDIGNDLAINMNETAAAVNEINDNIKNIKLRVINQSASVSQTHATMEQLTGNIRKLDSNVEKQSSHVSAASAAIEEMVANTRSVTDTLVKNSANVKSLMDASEVGKTGLQDVASDIQEISRESEGLLEINTVMENIASQTNLLSMNAAIEAAHAGEAGKGFAVVADEIRKLAESSSEQSKTIGTVLKKMKDSVDKITKSTENVLDKFEAIDSNVRIVAQQEDNIRNAMEEQGIGSKQVLEGVSMINELSQQVLNSSKEMLTGAKEVIDESNNLEMVSQEISTGVNEMSNGADQINMTVKEINKISGKNREGINVLIKEVSQFKVE
ncbi:MAG: methyl-accepting chemotaxis protein [Treponema sp.]|nr:methyl-accepting chemotaxis protein [Treponema sp.]